MEISIHWIAVIVAALVSMALGAIWYTEGLFGKRWIKAAGITKKQAEANSTKPMIYAALRAFFMALIMYIFIFVFDAFHSDRSWLANALLTSILAGFGFTWTAMKMHDLFEIRSKDIMMINIGFEVVDFLLVGLAIGLIAG